MQTDDIYYGTKTKNDLIPHQKFQSLLRAYCTSPTCTHVDNNNCTKRISVPKPNARKTDAFCYDCGHALKWTHKGYFE